MKEICLNFKVEEDLLLGVERLQRVLGFTMGDGITVQAEQGEKLGVCKQGNTATIYYGAKHQFFRELGVLVENLRKNGGDFEVVEDGFFETVATMVDASRCGAPTVEAFYKLADRLALMGYNMIMLYLEDLVKLPTKKYFGYMRGRYSQNEIKEIDAYALSKGMELIPCIQTLGHFTALLNLPVYRHLRDADDVILAGSEEVYDLIDKIFSSISN